MAEKKTPAWKFVASLGAIALFGGIALGTTYSLFTSSKKVNTHIQIADKDSIKASLYLKELKQDVLASDGTIEKDCDMLSTITNNSGEIISPDKNGYVDLTDYKGSIFSTVKLVPTMTGKATFVLKNNGTIAFNYVIQDTRSAYLADGTKSETAKILDQVTLATDIPESTTVKKGEEAEITVSYVFKNSEDNNDVMSQTIDLDLVFVVSSVTK